MPEILGQLASAAGPALEAGGEAAASAAPSAFGSAGDLAAAGLPFAAGAGELGSVATGLGASGVSGFAEALPALAGAGAGIGGAGGALSLGAGAGEVGSNVAGIGADLSGFGSSALPSSAGLTSGALPGGGGVAGFNVDPSVGAGGGVTSVGPSAGTPASALGEAAFPGAGGGAAAPVAAAAPAGAGSLDLTSMLSKAAGNISPVGAALGAAGLGYNIWQGQKQTASTQAIQDQAAKVAGQASDLAGQGKQLTSHLESGTLPPNIQQQVDDNVKAAKTKIISNYAAQGMNTDPNKNSSLRQELQSVDNQAKIMSGQLAQQLAQSGTNLINAGTQLTGLDNNLLTTLSNIDQTQTQRVGTAIANFAAALNGNKGGINLKLA